MRLETFIKEELDELCNREKITIERLLDDITTSLVMVQAQLIFHGLLFVLWGRFIYFFATLLERQLRSSSPDD